MKHPKQSSLCPKIGISELNKAFLGGKHIWWLSYIFSGGCRPQPLYDLCMCDRVYAAGKWDYDVHTDTNYNFHVTE